MKKLFLLSIVFLISILSQQLPAQNIIDKHLLTGSWLGKLNIGAISLRIVFNLSLTERDSLTVPEGEGPFPAAVLITGSGSQNRNEEIMGHKPFLVIADYLTRNEIAVLRYDDRGVGESKGNTLNSTTADFATDAEAAMKYLHTRPEIIPEAIGLIGHSEGGLIAPIVAASNPVTAFIISLAGIGVKCEKITEWQLREISRVIGIDG